VTCDTHGQNAKFARNSYKNLRFTTHYFCFQLLHKFRFWAPICFECIFLLSSVSCNIIKTGAACRMSVKVKRIYISIIQQSLDVQSY